MPATVKNCPLQCAASVEEQGIDQVVWQVLGTGGYIGDVWDVSWHGLLLLLPIMFLCVHATSDISNPQK
jgi:hypothetical protein